MVVVKRFLDNHVDCPTIKQDMVQFFGKHHELLNSIVKEVSGGKFLTKVTTDIFKEVEAAYDDPDRGIKAIIDLGIPVKKYREFAQFNTFVDPDTNTWKHKRVNGALLPNTWPSNTRVTKRWAELRESFEIRTVPEVDYYAAAWRVDKWLNYVLNSPFYSLFIEDRDNLEIIIKGDGFKAGKQQYTFLLSSLGNFGRLSKCVIFNFVINLAEVEEKDTENLRTAFDVNCAILEEWIEAGELITPEGRKVKVRVERCGDEMHHRSMLDLKDSSCEDICLHCYETRAACMNGAKHPRFPRYLFTFDEAGKRKLRDHRGRPVLGGKDIWSIHYCIMHGTIPFGKNILSYYHKWCNNHQTKQEIDNWKVVIDAFLRSHNIKVSMTRGPSRRGWNIKATETFELFKHIQELCDLLHMDGAIIVPLVRELVDKLKVLYTWEFTTVEDWDALHEYERTMPGFITTWRRTLGLMGKYHNYYHTLSVEVPKSIRRKGSAWKYSSDITETFVHLMKDMFLSYTTRGGCDQNPCKQVIERCCMRSMAYTKGFGSVSLMISPHEWKKISDYADISSYRWDAE